MNLKASIVSLADTDWGHMGNWGAAGWLGMIAFWVLLGLFVYWLARTSASPQDKGEPSARHTLEHRLAAGEISVDEYRERIAALEGPLPTP